MDPPGTLTGLDELTVPKARALAEYLASGKHDYAFLVATRRDAASGFETVVFDVVLGLSQVRVHPVRERERVAATFDPADDAFS